MARQIVIVCVLCLCLQVHAGVLKDIGSGIISQYANKLQSWQQETYQKFINNGKSTQNELQAAIEKLRSNIKQKIAVAGEKESIAEKCWDEQHDRIEAIESKFNADSQKCVDDNIGPAVDAATKFEEDLDLYANHTQELLEEAEQCGFNWSCQKNVAKQLKQLQEEMGKLLLEDYFDLEQKSLVAADAIRRCESEVLAEESAALKEVYDAVQKCIDDKETSTTKNTVA